MKIQQYSDIAASTAFYPDCDKGTFQAVTYCTVGLGGEVGELQNKLKKHMRDIGTGHLSAEHGQALLDEAGDVLWYLDRLVHELGSSLEAVASANLNKILTRQLNGTLSDNGGVR